MDTARLGWFRIPKMSQICSATYLWEYFDTKEWENTNNKFTGCIVALLKGTVFGPKNTKDSQILQREIFPDTIFNYFILKLFFRQN